MTAVRILMDSVMSSLLILTNCKLTYYYDKRYVSGDVYGEAARLAMAMKSIPFEDDRIKKKQLKEWLQGRNGNPAPPCILALKDGRKLHQKKAMLRLVAKETKLYPLEDHWKAAEVDAVLDGLGELFQQQEEESAAAASAAVVNEKGGDDNKKKHKRGSILDLHDSQQADGGNRIPKLLEKIDSLLDPETGYAVGNSLTVADLFVYAITWSTYGQKKMPSGDKLNIDNLLSVRKRVDAHLAMAQQEEDLGASLKNMDSF